jgi:hypothetical protein
MLTGTIFESRASRAVRTSADAPPSGEPERKLLEAILQDAIECWQRCALIADKWAVSPSFTCFGQRQREYIDADPWLFGEYDNYPLFSFTKICDCLGIDPEFIRRRLLEWKRAQFSASEEKH